MPPVNILCALFKTTAITRGILFQLLWNMQKKHRQGLFTYRKCFPVCETGLKMSHSIPTVTFLPFSCLDNLKTLEAIPNSRLHSMFFTWHTSPVPFIFLKFYLVSASNGSTFRFLILNWEKEKKEANPCSPVTRLRRDSECSERIASLRRHQINMSMIHL